MDDVMKERELAARFREISADYYNTACSVMDNVYDQLDAQVTGETVEFWTLAISQLEGLIDAGEAS